MRTNWCHFNFETKTSISFTHNVKWVHVVVICSCGRFYLLVQREIWCTVAAIEIFIANQPARLWNHWMWIVYLQRTWPNICADINMILLFIEIIWDYCAIWFVICVYDPDVGQWRRDLMFSFTCAWINAWVNNGEAGDLRRHRAHYDVTTMYGAFYYLTTEYF